VDVTRTETRGRVDFLDGLRGLAAFLVVISHCASAMFPAVAFGTTASGNQHVLYAAPILNLPFQGGFMVCLFYVLSGLALSYHTLSRRSRAPAVSGAVRRYPRLMVPVLAGTLLGALLLRLSLEPVRQASLVTGSVWWFRYRQFDPPLGDALYSGTIGVFRTSYSAYDPPLWTMHNEFLGSLLVFAVLLVLPRRWLRVVAYCVVAVLSRGGYMTAFVAGMAICEAWIVLGDRPRRWMALLVPLGLYGLVLASTPIAGANRPDFYVDLLPQIFGRDRLDQRIAAQVIGATLILAALVALKPLQRPFRTRPLLFLGRISFALYIVHFLVLNSIGAGIVWKLRDATNITAVKLFASATVIVVSIGAAWLFTRLVDEPTLAVLSRGYKGLEQWFRRARPGARAATARTASPDTGGSHV
jgi:peptidoglycan/LPS O-acetylase OafA/YrhL